MEKRENFLRFYAVRKDLSSEDKEVMNLLRNQTTRKIILSLLESKQTITIQALSKKTELDRVVLLFHLSKLEKIEILKKSIVKGKNKFSIKNKQQIIELLDKYQKSFLDSLVDNFIDTWKSLEAE